MSRTVTYDEPVEEVVVDQSASPFAWMSSRELMMVILCGVGIGLATGIIYFLLNKFVFSAVLCRPQSPTNCSEAPNYAMIVAVVIGTITGVANLARMRVYRPLLIALAVLVSLWGIQTPLSHMVWYWALLGAGILTGLAYGLFAWLSRIRNFIFALVVIVVVVVIVRLMLSA